MWAGVRAEVQKQPQLKTKFSASSCIKKTREMAQRMKCLLDKLRVPAPTLKSRHTMMAGVCDRSSSMQNQALRKVHLVTHPSKPGSSNGLLVRDPILNHVKNNIEKNHSLIYTHTHSCVHSHRHMPTGIHAYPTHTDVQLFTSICIYIQPCVCVCIKI